MPPKKNKRPRTDSASEQSRILAAAFMDIKPPKNIRMKQADIVFFDSIIAEQANAEWTNHGIQIAALMARTMGNLEREESLLRKEGSVKKTKTGYPVVNPRVAIVQRYGQLILSYRRSLAIHVRAQGVNPADIARRKENAKEVQGLAEDFDDDLIARPGKIN